MTILDPERAWRDLRVGLVTFFALLLLIAGVTFAGGDKGLLFRKTGIVRARMTDIGGLKRGSTVAIGGMSVGKVTNIQFVGGPSNTQQIEVTMDIRSDVRNRIKADSVPAVRTQGMLGDRYIDLSFGSEDSPALAEGEILKGASATDFDQTLREAQDVLKEVQKLLAAINRKQGTVGRFFYDERFYGNLMEITDEVNDLIKDFKKQPRKYVKFSIF